MSIASFQIAAIKQRERETPSTITHNGTSYAIVPGSKTRGGTLDIGGVTINYDFSCTVRRSLFTTLPKSKQTITHGGETLRIESVVEAGGNSHIRLLCVASNRGV